MVDSLHPASEACDNGNRLISLHPNAFCTRQQRHIRHPPFRRKRAFHLILVRIHSPSHAFMSSGVPALVLRRREPLAHSEYGGTLSHHHLRQVAKNRGMNCRSRRSNGTCHESLLRTVLFQLNSSSASVGTVYGALHCAIALVFSCAVIHLVGLPAIEKYLIGKYFSHFGTNHAFCEMKKNAFSRRELVVGCRFIAS